MKSFLLVLTTLLQLVILSQNKSSLSMDEIMQGEGFIGNLPHSLQWLPNNQVIFQKDLDNNRVDEFFIIDSKTNQFKPLKAADLVKLPQDGVVQQEITETSFYSTKHMLRLWGGGAKESQVLIKDLDGFDEIYTVTNTDVIYFQQNWNIYRFYLRKSLIEQVTNFKKGEKKTKKSLSDTEKYLERQQLELFEVIRNENARKEERKRISDADTLGVPLEIFTDKNYLNSITISPDEKYIAFILSDYPKTENTHIESYVTESGKSKSINARPKVGRKDPIHKLGVYNLETNKVVYLKIKDLEDITKKPEYFQLYDEKNVKYDAPKNVVFHGLYYSKTGKAIVEIKSYDNKERWIALVDLKTGNLTEIEHQHDSAWIGGPGISSWNEVAGNVGWLKDGKTVYFQSEESGFSHLYLYDTEKGKKIQLTDGNFEIHSAQLSKDGSTFYISANKKHAGNREFYHFIIKTKKWIPILAEDGNYEVEISNNEKLLAYRYSYKNKPWEIFITENKEGNKPVQITHSLRESFQKYPWRAPEIITFKANDGADVPARIYTPTDENSNHAAVIFVHGAGYLQNAHNWWSGYYREYMFHNLLVDNGYTVLDIDYRASKGYGRDWRTAIYRYMGGKDLSDQVDGKRYLVEKQGVDASKIGIYGGSYGGFISVMAMLTTDEFPCAAAIRSVTDWAHYNHEYTSNILNTPTTDSIAYRRSSPIYFADALEGKLLMLHGIVDNNVQYQDVVRLSQRFIELKKHNWDLVGYPVEPHGFKEASSWVDEYGRIFRLFQEMLR